MVPDTFVSPFVSHPEANRSPYCSNARFTMVGYSIIPGMAAPSLGRMRHSLHNPFVTIFAEVGGEMQSFS